MPVYTRQQLSGSNNGMPIIITATGPATADIIHQVQATSTSVFEMVWLKLTNISTVDRIAKIDLISATATETMSFHLDDRDAATGPIVLFEGLPLTGTDTLLQGYATVVASANIWYAEGYVNRIATG